MAATFRHLTPNGRTVTTHTLWDKDTPLVVSDDLVPEEELAEKYRLRRLRVTMDAWINDGRVEVVEEVDEATSNSYTGTEYLTFFKVGAQRWPYTKEADLTEAMVAAIGLAVQFAEKPSPVNPNEF